MARKIKLDFKISRDIYDALVLKKGEKSWEDFFNEIIIQILGGKSVNQSEIEELRKNNELLKSGIHNLETENNKLKERIAELEQEITNLKTENQELEKELSQYRPVIKPASEVTKQDIRPEVEQTYGLFYEGKTINVATVKVEGDHVVYKPLIPVPANIFSHLRRTASALNVKLEEVEDANYIKEFTIYNKPDLNEQAKAQLKKAIDWVFKTSYQKLNV